MIILKWSADYFFQWTWTFYSIKFTQIVGVVYHVYHVYLYWSDAFCNMPCSIHMQCPLMTQMFSTFYSVSYDHNDTVPNNHLYKGWYTTITHCPWLRTLLFCAWYIHIVHCPVLHFTGQWSWEIILNKVHEKSEHV